MLGRAKRHPRPCMHACTRTRTHALAHAAAAHAGSRGGLGAVGARGLLPGGHGVRNGAALPDPAPLAGVRPAVWRAKGGGVGGAHGCVVGGAAGPLGPQASSTRCAPSLHSDARVRNNAGKLDTFAHNPPPHTGRAAHAAGRVPGCCECLPHRTWCGPAASSEGGGARGGGGREGGSGHSAWLGRVQPGSWDHRQECRKGC